MSLATDPQAGTAAGEALRQLRRENGWTLAEVSRRTGVSISSLSKIENGVSTPTYSVLTRLSEGLGIDYTRLLGLGGNSFATGARVITRAGEGERFATGMGQYLHLASDLAHKSMQPMIIEIPLRDVTPRKARSDHPGEEFVMVLEGQVIFEQDPYAPALLSMGDSLYFDSASPHAFSARGAGPARILSICMMKPSSSHEKT